MRKFTHRKKSEGVQMAYPNQYQPYQYQYAPQVQPPMDRLAQLQAQQYQMMPIQMSGTSQPPQTNQGLLWVQGEAGAKSYLVAPNTTVLLMDSEGSRFYLKSTDNAVMPSLRVFEYSEVSQNAQQAPQSEQINLDDKYVTRHEYDALQGKYMEILERLNNFPSSGVSADDGKRTTATANKSRSRGGADNE